MKKRFEAIEYDFFLSLSPDSVCDDRLRGERVIGVAEGRRPGGLVRGGEENAERGPQGFRQQHLKYNGGGDYFALMHYATVNSLMERFQFSNS